MPGMAICDYLPRKGVIIMVIILPMIREEEV